MLRSGCFKISQFTMSIQEPGIYSMPPNQETKVSSMPTRGNPCQALQRVTMGSMADTFINQWKYYYTEKSGTKMALQWNFLEKWFHIFSLRPFKIICMVSVTSLVPFAICSRKTHSLPRTFSKNS